jgi:hypothetical protein
MSLSDTLETLLTAIREQCYPDAHPDAALEAVEAASTLLSEVAEARRVSVLLARRGGATWAQLGDAMGVSAQGAQQGARVELRRATALRMAGQASLLDDDGG